MFYLSHVFHWDKFIFCHYFVNGIVNIYFLGGSMWSFSLSVPVKLCRDQDHVSDESQKTVHGLIICI